MSDVGSTADDPYRTETISDGAPDLLDQLAEEFTARYRKGEFPSIGEYEARHPEHAEKIRKFLTTVALMEQMKGLSPSSRGGAGDLPVPERLGEFRVVRELGRGGMGVVYEAVQESLGRHVALKVIHHVHLDAKRLQRFQRETQAVARLHHANIVPIFGAGEHEGLPYYVMQYIQGSGLDALLGTWRQEKKRRNDDHWRFVAAIGVQAAEALQYAHEQGILHRDIKPANLLLDEHQAVWVTDFGLAKLTGHDDLTASGDVIGTLRYLAPEALRGETDCRSDVYSLGLTLYELLTLTSPFGEMTPSELLRHVSEGRPTRPRRLDSAIPRDLETIVLKAIAKEPGHRYATAGAISDDLKCFLADRPIHARRVTLVERAWRWSRRNRTTAALGATAAVSMVVAAVIGWVGYAITTRALENESKRRTEAENATKRAERNVALSLEVFGALFDNLTPKENLLPPPPGRTGRPSRPAGGLDVEPAPPPGTRGQGSPPPGPGGDPFNDRPFQPDQRPGMSDRPAPPPVGNPFDGERRGEGGPPRRGGTQNDTALLRSVLNFYDRFAQQNTTNPKLQGEAAWAYRRVGALYERLGQDDDAQKANARAIEIFEELVAQFPREPKFRLNLVNTYIMADPWSADPSQLKQLEEQLSEARVLIDQLVAEAPENLDDAQAQVHVHAKLGAVLQRLDRPEEADAFYRRAIALAGSLIERSPRPLRGRLDRTMIRENLAELLFGRGRKDEARAILEAATADMVSLRKESKSSMVAEHFKNLSEVFENVGEMDRAQEVLRYADEIRTPSSRDDHGPGERGPRSPGTGDEAP